MSDFMEKPERNEMRDKVTKAFAYTHMDDPLWDRVSQAFDWEYVWPEIDGEFRLTGAVIEQEDRDYFPVAPSHDAVIHRDVAAAAGWVIDLEEGCAYGHKGRAK